MKRIALVIVIAMAMVMSVGFALAAPSAPNLISNPSFESGLSGWSSNLVSVITDTLAPSGTHVADNGGAQGAWMEQTIPSQPAGSYVWSYSCTGDGVAQVYTPNFSVSDIIYCKSQPGVWVTHKSTITLAVSSTLNVYAEFSYQGDSRFDAFSLSCVTKGGSSKCKR